MKLLCFLEVTRGGLEKESKTSGEECSMITSWSM